MTNSLKNNERPRNALVIEDEMLIAMMVEDVLIEGGYEVVGPVASVAEAMRLLESGQTVDVAVLDLNLAGSSSLAVADALSQANIPFVVTTGYGSSSLPPPHQAAPVLSKPFAPADLLQILEQFGRCK